MKYWKLGLSGLLALFIAVPAFAQGTVLYWGQTNRKVITTDAGQVVLPTLPIGVQITGGVSAVDSSGVPNQYDSFGNHKVAEAFPPMDANLTFANIIQNASLALGAADSSAILDTHRMRLGMLLFKCSNGTTTGTGDTTVTFRVAFQIRTHLNGASDSSSTFAVYSYGNTSIGATATTPGDTTASGHLLTGTPTTALNATPDANTPWSGEYTLVVMAKRFAHGSAFAINGHTYYYPSGIAIPLSSIFGRDIYSPYTSIRVRVMTVEKANAAFATEGLNINVSLVGTPL